jgi:hypothetical protein
MQYLFNFSGRQYVVIDGINITDTTLSATDRSIKSNIERAIGNGSYITIKNCKFDRVGLAAYFTGPFNVFDGCDVGNMRMIVNTNDGPPPGLDNDYGSNGIVISSSNNTITRSYFHDCWASSFDYGYDGGGIEFFGPSSGNTITYNTFFDNNGELEMGSNSGGTISDVTIAYNRYINNGSFMLVQNGTNFTVSVSNIQVYNNVIIQNAVSPRGQSSSMMRFRNSTPPAGTGLIVLRNNIVYLTTGIPWTRSGQLTGTALIRSNNLYLTTGGSVVNYTLNGTEATFSTPGQMWESVLGQAISWNYTPAAASPAINFGTQVGFNTDFIGKPITGNPDAGIIERTAVVQQPFKALIKFVQ